MLSTRPPAGPELGGKGGRRSWLEAIILLQAPPAEKKLAGRKRGKRDHPTGASRGAPGPDGEVVQLPRRPRPKGETAACAGPAGGHGGGAQRAGPEREPRRHISPGFSAVGKRKGIWDALLASKPKRAAQHRSPQPGPARRETQSPEVAKTRPRWAEQPPRSTFWCWPCARRALEARPSRREPWDGVGGAGESRKAPWDKEGLVPAHSF